MSLIKKLAGDTLIYGMAHILPRLLYFVLGMTYITYRFPDKESVGIYNILYAYTALILTIMVFRLDTAFFRFGRDQGTSKTVFATALIPLLFMTLVICSLVQWYAPAIAEWMSYGDTPQYLRWFALIIAFDTVSALFYAKFRLENRPFRFLFYKVANVLFIISFTLLFLEVFPRIWPSGINYVQQVFTIEREIDYTFIANLLASIVVLIFMLPEVRKVEWSFDWGILRRMLHYSWPLVIVGIAGIISQSFSTPLQERWISEDLVYNRSQAGIYGSVTKLALLLNLLIVAFNYAAEPFFFNYADRKESKDLYGAIAFIFTIVVCLAAILVITYMDIIQYLIGAEYREGLHVIPYLLFAFIFLGLYYNFSIWYKLSDHTRIGAIISVIGMVIMVSINFIWLPKIGYVASAYAALTCYGFMAVAGWATGQRYYPIHYPIIKILNYILTAAIIIIALTWLRHNTNYPIWLIGTISLLFYIGNTYIKDGTYIRSLFTKDQI